MTVGLKKEYFLTFSSHSASSHYSTQHSTATPPHPTKSIKKSNRKRNINRDTESKAKQQKYLAVSFLCFVFISVLNSDGDGSKSKTLINNIN